MQGGSGFDTCSVTQASTRMMMRKPSASAWIARQVSSRESVQRDDRATRMWNGAERPRHVTMLTVVGRQLLGCPRRYLLPQVPAGHDFVGWRFVLRL